MHETPEGFLLCIGVPVARTGEMVYAKSELPDLEADSEGRILVNRDEKEVFNPRTIASFEGKPITIGHPDDFVTPETWKTLSKGIMQNVRRGEGQGNTDLIADLLITDADAIARVKRGLREVSCGYLSDFSQTAPGKGEQSKIIGNHLALVDEGRAGSDYAITDHKGKGVTSMSKTLGEKIKAMFVKAGDEAAKAMSDEGAVEEKVVEKTDDAMKNYDELVQMCKDLGEKLSALAPKAKDASAEEEKPAEEEKKAADEEVAPSLEARLKALEDKVAALMEGESVEASMDEEADEEEVSDAEEEEGLVETGDTAARAEILAPGIKLTKDVKSAALKAALGTVEGKKVIDALTGGKAIAFDSAEKVDSLFIAASELLKSARTEQVTKTKKTHDFVSGLGVVPGAFSPEQMNERNAKFYGLK